MSNKVYIHKLIKDLEEDDSIMLLLKEIEMVIRLPLSMYTGDHHQQVIHYLKDYRLRRKIGKDGIEAHPFPKELMLTKKITKLHGTDVYMLCHELASLHGSSIEKEAGRTLYVFLDSFLKDKKKKSYPPQPAYMLQ